MEPFSPEEIRAHVERICDSNAFRAAPKLSRVLRFLAEQTLSGDSNSIGQRLVAERALGIEGGAGATAIVAARMQIGRLRKHLEDYYAGEGREDPLRVEVPKRNYRLRFRPPPSAAPEVSPRARDRAGLVVAEFHDLSASPESAWLQGALTRECIVALGTYQGLSVSGPLPADAVASVMQGASRIDADFVLVGDVRPEPQEAHVSLRLLERGTGQQLWARGFSCPLTAAGRLPAGDLPQLREAVDALADETGVVACEGMRRSVASRPECGSAYDTKLAAWRFLMTGVPADLERAAVAAAGLAEAVPDSPSALMHASMMQMAIHLGDSDPGAAFPREILALAERAFSLAPADPWVQAHRGFALWVGREPLVVEGICRSLDGRAGSPSFLGVLGSLMTVAAIDLERGEALLTECLARAPQPLYWFCHHAALCGFRRGDLDAMQHRLARISVRTDPFSLVLRMVLACERGDLDAARRLGRTVLEVTPDFPRFGEVMLRRLLHDEHVDAIAAALVPLGLGWFE